MSLRSAIVAVAMPIARIAAALARAGDAGLHMLCELADAVGEGVDTMAEQGEVEMAAAFVASPWQAYEGVSLPWRVIGRRPALAPANAGNAVAIRRRDRQYASPCKTRARFSGWTMSLTQNRGCFGQSTYPRDGADGSIEQPGQTALAHGLDDQAVAVLAHEHLIARELAFARDA